MAQSHDRIHLFLDAAMNPIRLLIVDDHDFFRRSILLPLDVEPDIEIVGTATSGDQAVTLARSLRPDVILMDLNMPYLSGLGAMERIVPQERAPAILVLTGKDDAQSVLDAFAAGAQGFLRKDMITDDLLISAIFTVASGGVFVDGRTFRLIKNSFLAGQPKMAGERQGHIQLSPDERHAPALCRPGAGQRTDRPEAPEHPQDHLQPAHPTLSAPGRRQPGAGRHLRPAQWTG